MIVKTTNLELPDEDVIAYAAKLIKAGAAVVFPSDTAYGLAVNPQDQAAVKRLFKIKQRPADKQVSCIFGDLEQVKKWAYVDRKELRILERNLPGPFTFILRAPPEYPISSETVGVRIPASPVTKALAAALGEPYTATSANRSSLPACYSPEDIQAQFEGQIYQPDVLLDAGRLAPFPPSAVIDIREGAKTVLREGIARVR